MKTYEDFLAFCSTMRRPGFGLAAAAREILKGPIDTVCHYLNHAIHSENIEIVGEALALFGKVSPPLAAAAAIDLLEHQDPNARWIAADILEEVGEVLDEPKVIRRLEIELNPEVRFALVSALRRVGTAKSIPLIKRLSSTDSATDFEGRTISQIASRVIEAIENR